VAGQPDHLFSHVLEEVERSAVRAEWEGCRHRPSMAQVEADDIVRVLVRVLGRAEEKKADELWTKQRHVAAQTSHHSSSAGCV